MSGISFVTTTTYLSFKNGCGMCGTVRFLAQPFLNGQHHKRGLLSTTDDDSRCGGVVVYVDDVFGVSCVLYVA